MIDSDVWCLQYYPAQEIQESDIIAIRKAYDELKHGMEITAQGPYGDVRKVVVRVKPNN